jgi:ribosomal-protein-alanine acetyltransferase
VTWQLRRAGATDLDAIMAIESATFGTDAWSTAVMLGELTSPHAYYLVAFPVGSPQRIEGYAGLLAPRDAQQGDIQTIAVADTARRRGLGRTLVLSLIAEARDRGAREIFLEVRADNPGAKLLYDSLGFEQIAVRPKYYRPDGVDAIIMRALVPTPAITPAVGA